MKYVLGIMALCAFVVALVVGCGGSGSSNNATGGTSGGSSGGATTGGGTAGGTTTGGGGAPAPATIPTVNNSAAPMGYSFNGTSMQPVTVSSGTSVTWVNQSTAPHSIVWDAHTPSSSPSPGANLPVFQPGTNSQAFAAPTVTASTTYNYHCGIHGPTMSGEIIVTP